MLHIMVINVLNSNCSSLETDKPNYCCSGNGCHGFVFMYHICLICTAINFPIRPVRGGLPPQGSDEAHARNVFTGSYICLLKPKQSFFFAYARQNVCLFGGPFLPPVLLSQFLSPFYPTTRRDRHFPSRRCHAHVAATATPVLSCRCTCRRCAAALAVAASPSPPCLRVLRRAAVMSAVEHSLPPHLPSFVPEVSRKSVSNRKGSIFMA